jgi:hypothetical protein
MPAVIFADDFEGYASPSDLSSLWNGGEYQYVAPAAFSGTSLRFRNPLASNEVSNTVRRLVEPSCALSGRRGKRCTGVRG